MAMPELSLTLNPDGSFTMTGAAETLKDFFDVLEVAEGDVPDCVEEGMADEAEIDRDYTMENYYRVRNLIGRNMYPDTYQEVK